VSEGVVIITGANRGIGQAIARTLAEAGYPLALLDRDDSGLADLAASLGHGAKPYVVDIADFAQVEATVNAIQADFGAIYGLVNNAGIVRDALVVRMSPQDWTRVLEVNLHGTFFCTRCVAPLMMRQRVGRIVSISSVIGLTGNAGQANYAASKAGMIAMTKSVAKELGGRGVTCNAVAPGFISTDMTAALPEKVQQDMMQRIPLKRFGAAQDIAGAVKFLLSEDAAYITGQTLVVDGGMTM
jgi:3-oxoacyl-[acyl-carrier protein] reductase